MGELTIQQAFDLALQYHHAGQLSEAERLYQQVVIQQPANADAIHLLGVIAYQTRRYDAALDIIRRAIFIKPNFPEAYSNLGLALKDRGRFDEAIAALRHAIVLRPNYADAEGNLALALQAKRELNEAISQMPADAEALNNVGLVLKNNGQAEEAMAAFRRAIAVEPASPEACNNLGIALAERGRLEDAVAAYRQAIALRPESAVAFNNLGVALKEMGRLDEAVLAYRKAVALKPAFSQAYSNLGNALKDKKQFEDAIAAYRKAIALGPNTAEAHSNLGIALADIGELDEAITAYRQAIALRPNFPKACNNLANAQKNTGQLDDAIVPLRQAIELEPGFSEIHSNLIYTLHFHPDSVPKSLLKEHLEWARFHAEPLKNQIKPHLNERSADRRLKIGYVSPDFRSHCQSFFTIPLLSNHDRSQFEIYCYSSVLEGDSAKDPTTARIRGYADHWRDVAKLSDDELAEKVRQDKIDILVDLTMHMAHGRPLLFARKPAPVQVAWLAYPGTTGMSVMDYRLTDPYLDPPGTDESDYTEQTVRLADTFWCYDPLEEEPEPVTLPALAGRRFTFGCLNNFCKINEQVLELWAKVLRASPNSDLLLLAPRGQARRRVLESLGQKAIEPSRIQFVSVQPRPDYLKTFQRVDLCLDTFPSNGHTTSLDSIWMGVPVVSLTDGRIPMARGGVSILSNMGMKEFLAKDHQEFLTIAAGLPRDLNRLAEVRTGLRERMRRSPLMDGPRFARSMESAFRQMWHRWREAARPVDSGRRNPYP